MQRKVLLLLLLILIPHLSYSRKDTLWRFGLETGFSISYSGFSQNVCLVAQSGKNTIYLGPRINLTQSYLPERGVWGLSIGIRHNFIRSNTIKSFLNIDYQNTFMRPHLQESSFNSIHEFNYSYGFFYRINSNINIGNMIGFGRYWEIYKGHFNSNALLFSGYSGLIRAIIQYEF
jgi:hypothetical protein